MAQPYPQDMFLEGYFAPMGMECDAPDLIIEGELPTDLTGVYFRNGPDPLYPPREGEAYHWFHGDGMLQRFEFGGGRIAWRNRWVQTRKYELERAAGKSLFGVLGNPFNLDPSVAEEPYNTANTHIVYHGDRLLALMEGTNAVEINPDDLATLRDFNYDGAITGPITAHPKIDPVTNEMVFFGSQAGGPGSADIGYYIEDAAGALTHNITIPGPFSSMIHDFCVTENYSIFPVFPIVFSMERAMAGEMPMAWEPDRGTHFGIIPRHGKPEDVRWFTLDARFMFHMVNAYERDGKIVMDVTAANATQFAPKPDGSMAAESDGLSPNLRQWVIDPRSDSATVTETLLDDMTCEFPRTDDRYSTRSYRHAFAGGNSAGVALTFNSLVHYDMDNGARTLYTGGGKYLFGEPVFAPRDNASHEADGYLIDLAFNEETGLSELMIFDALSIDSGPVAKAMMTVRVPAGFHGSWVPAGDIG